MELQSEYCIQLAENERDVDAALKVASGIFIPEADISTAQYKQILWREDPEFRPENIVIVRSREGSIAGMTRIVPRVIHRGAEKISVAGISSVCIVPELRGRGLSVSLMNETLRICDERCFDIALLFARRAADFYYTRFGFYGIAAFQQIQVAIPPRLRPARSLELRAAGAEHIQIYDSAYRECHRDCFGWMERSPSYWNFLLKKVEAMPDVQLATIVEQERAVGYLAWSDSTIEEIACLEGVSTTGILEAVSRVQSDRWNFSFKIPESHRIVQTLQAFDVTISKRGCPFGGHMVRPLECLRLKMRTGGPKNPNQNFDNAELIRKHAEVCSLLGAWSPGQTVGDSRKPLDISLLDQF